MINFYQAIIMGFLQGITELFPISSLGHSVIIPQLLGWHLNQKAPYFLTFLVVIHLSTAIVLFLFFWRDWLKIIKAMIHSLAIKNISDSYAKLGWLIVVGTVPAGILGLVFESFLQKLFASSKFAATFLIFNGLLLFFAELLRRRSKKSTSGNSDERVARLSYTKSLIIGSMQALALFPGFSRTGASLSGGLLVGLTHEDALRFSFLMATPIIGAAALLKLTEAPTSGLEPVLGQMIAGAISTAIAAFFSVRFLVKYFRTNTLMPFAIYCFLAGSASLIYLIIK